MENVVSKLGLIVENQEVDHKGNYRISALFSKLSDLATQNAIEVGIWDPKLAGKYGFVLSKETMILKRPIKVDEKIVFNTRASNRKRVQFVRNYWIDDNNGEEIAAMFSLWTFIDLKNRKIMKPEKAGITMPEIKNYSYSIDSYHEIKKDLELEYVMERKVLYSDVDINQHMNNSRYIEWALDALDFKIFNDHYFSEISVFFKQEMPPETVAKIYCYIDDQYVKVVFKSLDDQIEYFEFGGYLESF